LENEIMRVFMLAGLIGLVGLGMPQSSDTPQILTLKVDGRANATPWMVARGNWVALTWGATRSEGGTDVFVVVSSDGGASFRTPVRVNAIEGEARLGGELPPRVAITTPSTGGNDTQRDVVGTVAPRAGGSPEIVVAYGARSANTEIKIARSRDGGRTFQPATALQAPGAKGDRGWHALTLDDRGRAHVIWLDHRGLAARTPTEHDHHKGGADMAQFSGLYYAGLGTAEAVSATQGGSGERELTKGVCYCCKTALATGTNGALYAAWRHVYPGNIRDIAFTTSRDNGETFVSPSRVSRDEWELAGCPDDGPAMTVGTDGVVHIVWPTVIGGPDPEGALFYASTRDGQTFTPRQRVPTLGGPKPGHPQIALTSTGQPVIAWDEIVGGVRRAATISTRLDSNGALSFDRPQTLSTDLASAYPILAQTGDGMLVAWTRGPAATSVIAIQRMAR
jgi:hypothetical protein